MPPRRTRRSSSDTGDNSLASADTSVLQSDIFGTTFSLHSVSPLFVGQDSLSAERLFLLATRLRDGLVGDVVRGVEVGLDGAGEETAMGNAGALDAVTIEWAGLDAGFWIQQRAIQITLRYENALCSALLLPVSDQDSTSSTRGGSEASSQGNHEFLHLPLLLLRMPAPLKVVVVGFLADTFDCRIASIRLQSQDLIQIWETWARDTRLPSLGPLAKDTVLTLGFRLSGPGQALSIVRNAITSEHFAGDVQGLRTVDIIIAHQDLSRFLKTGQKLATDGKKASQPFTTALVSYVKHHLALDISNPSVSVVRIACGGFVLGEGRIKIFPVANSGESASRHQTAASHILEGLALRASAAT